jgi:hypothetical protein
MYGISDPNTTRRYAVVGAVREPPPQRPCLYPIDTQKKDRFVVKFPLDMNNHHHKE